MGIDVLLFAEVGPVVSGASPTFVAICGFIGIGGAAMAAAFTQFRTAALKTEATRVALAMQSCEERSERLETKIDDLERRLRESETKAAIWETRYQSLIAKSREIPSSSPPRKENT